MGRASTVAGFVEVACPKHHIALVVVVIAVLAVECTVGVAAAVQGRREKELAGGVAVVDIEVTGCNARFDMAQARGE